MPTETLTLTEFLLARITEDEAALRTVRSAVVNGDELRVTVRLEAFKGDRWVVLPDATWRASVSRLAAECKAKRAIVEIHETIAAAYPGTTIETDPCCQECSAFGEYPGIFPCSTLRAVAAVYADHPDYNPEWTV
jgi:hypothetical protein